MRERWRRRPEPAPQRPAAPKPLPVRTPDAGLLGYREIRTFLDPGTQVSGKLSFSTPTRIEGRVRGEVRASDLLIIAPRGSLVGTVWPTSLIVAGEIRGQILGAGRVEIQPGGKVVGVIECKTLIIPEGASFEGDCYMQGESHAVRDESVRG